MIDEFNPTTLVSVSFPSKHSVNLGNTLTPEDTKDRPLVQATPESGYEDAVYTLVTPISEMIEVHTFLKFSYLGDDRP